MRNPLPSPPWNPSNLYANQPINQRRTSRVSLAKWQLPIGACADHERATTGLNLFFTDETSFGLNGAVHRSTIDEPFPWDGRIRVEHPLCIALRNEIFVRSDSIVHPLFFENPTFRETINEDHFSFVRESVRFGFPGAHSGYSFRDIRACFISR